MNEVFDIYTIIFLAIAVFIFLRLRSVLGRRTGHERPPFDPYSAPNTQEAKRPAPASDSPSGDTVVELPGRNGVGAARARPDRWKGVAKSGSPLAKAFDSFVTIDARFDPREFLEGAKMAYEMIVTAFAAGDRDELRPLLSKDVFEGFSEAIEEREKRGQTVESNFVGIDSAELIDAALRGTTAHLTARISSKLISVTRSGSGDIVEGDPQKVRGVVDVWTFARDLSSPDPNWKLVATEAD